MPSLPQAVCLIRILAVLALGARIGAGSSRADSIAEGFDQRTTTSLVAIASATGGEKIVRTASSRFAWGAYSQAGDKFIGLLPDLPSAHCSLYFDLGTFLPGNYAYTRFDQTTVPASGASVPSRRIDLSPPASRIIVTAYWSWYPVKVAFLLRDRSHWWRSSDIGIAAIEWNQRLDTRYERDPKALTWVRLAATEDMDEVDDGGAVALVDGPAGTPEWGAIEGMGLMCRSGTAADKVYIAGLSLTDGNLPRVDLREPMKNSDVAFLHLPSPLEKFDEYGGVKLVTWDSGWSVAHVALTRNHGVRDAPAASMGVITYSQIQEGTPLKEAISKDLWGKEITEGNPNFPAGRQARMCIRHPAFEEYVKDYVKRRIYDVGAREALMDEPSGGNGFHVIYRNHAGCYCDRCNDGFRDWLRTRFGAPELAAMGINAVGRFDYRTLLRAQAADLAEFQKKFDQDELPHLKLYIRFQQEPARAFFRQVRDYMLALDPAFKLASNTFDLRQEMLYLAEENRSDFHGAEMELYTRWPNEFGKLMGRLKLADALGIRIVSSGSWWNWDWARSQAHGATQTTRTIIAGMYASGHQLVAPDLYRWISPQYYGSIPAFAPLYRFVRAHPELFDDYRAVEQVGLIYDNSVAGAHTGDAVFRADFDAICMALLDATVPFGIAAGADGFFHRREFSGEELARRFQIIVEPRNTHLAGGQREAVAGFQLAGRAHTWNVDGMTGLRPKLRSWVACDRARVWVLPRRHATDAGAPLVVHVLNRNLRQDTAGSTDELMTQRDVAVDLHAGLWGGQRTVGSVSAFEVPEDGQGTSLAFKRTTDGIRVMLPAVGLWKILRLDLVPVGLAQSAVNPPRPADNAGQSVPLTVAGDSLDGFHPSL